MAENLKLPVGIENFAEIRREGFYYVDKTRLIEQLLNQWGKVNLFTRPRRFGKTLNMSMLRYFFEIGMDQTLFEGLYISQNNAICDEYMGKFPVIFLTLKNVDGLSYDEAKYCLSETVAKEARRLSFLANSECLSDNDKERYRALINLPNADSKFLPSSLQVLSELLYKHYARKVIILIDEYDVPLDKAYQHGYYHEMVSLIRGFLGQAMKTNDALHFSVLTGCLRVSKESIFTGLNNFKILSITDARFDEQFGFTGDEVSELLNAYHLESHIDEVKQWYDGYRFGDADVYCPWDVINHVDRLRAEPDAEPQSYWINTSGNDLVKRFIDKSDKTTKDEIERLVAGEAIEKRVRLELTYDEIDKSIDNLWSVLFTTGYLTQQGKAERGVYKLKIPNEEVREVFKYQIQEWFNQSVSHDTTILQNFWKAFEVGNAQDIETRLTHILSRTISVLDPKGTEEVKERYYHAFLAGLLFGNGAWIVHSNVEAGEGFADLIIESDDPDSGIIIELKVADSLAALGSKCDEAIAQIHNRRYDEYLRNEGRNDIWAYGIAFYKKRCKVIVEKLSQK